MKEQAQFPLFVYGSLMSGFRSPAYEYISGYFDLAGAASVQGMLFDMGDYPAAVPTRDEHRITGELYRVRNAAEFNWAITQLDDYEGVLVEPGQPRLYRRELAEVRVADDTVMAWIYWYNGDVSGRPVIASGNLMDYISGKQ